MCSTFVVIPFTHLCGGISVVPLLHRPASTDHAVVTWNVVQYTPVLLSLNKDSSRASQRQFCFQSSSWNSFCLSTFFPQQQLLCLFPIHALSSFLVCVCGYVYRRGGNSHHCYHCFNEWDPYCKQSFSCFQHFCRWLCVVYLKSTPNTCNKILLFWDCCSGVITPSCLRNLFPGAVQFSLPPLTQLIPILLCGCLAKKGGAISAY